MNPITENNLNINYKDVSSVKTRIELPRWKIICIVIGSLFVAALVIVLIVVLVKYKKPKPKEQFRRSKNKERFESNNQYTAADHYVKSYIASVMGVDSNFGLGENGIDNGIDGSNEAVNGGDNVAGDIEDNVNYGDVDLKKFEANQ